MAGRPSGARTALAWVVGAALASSAMAQVQKLPPPPERQFPPGEKPSEKPKDKPGPDGLPQPAPAQAENSGQPKPADPPPAQPRDDKADELRSLQEQRPVKPGAIMPTAKEKPAAAPAKREPVVSMPDLLQESAQLPKRRFYPEGTFLSRRNGSLFRTGNGDVIFIPVRDGSGKGEAPMVLLPCQTLGRLEIAPSVFDKGTTVTLSGQVFVYADRQFMLPSVFATVSPDSAPKPAEKPGDVKPAPAAPVKPQASPLNETDPAVAELIRDLETRRSAAKAVEPPTPAAKPRPDGDPKPKPADKTDIPAVSSDVKAVVPEGTVLFNSRGRLTRLADGRFAVAFDGDTESPASAPMVLLRCRMVQKLEELAQARGDAVLVSVSGRVMVYNGKNFLLPTLAQVLPSTELKPMQ